LKNKIVIKTAKNTCNTRRGTAREKRKGNDPC